MLKTDDLLRYLDIRLPDTKLSGHQYGFVSGLMIYLSGTEVTSNHNRDLSGYPWASLQSTRCSQ